MSSGALVVPGMTTAVGPQPVRGKALAEPVTWRPAALAWEDGVITYAGPADDPTAAPFIDGARQLDEGHVIPGFVDCHTHLPFFGWRDDEFAARLAGVTYRDLHGTGGIPRSARMLAEASDDEVMDFCLPLVAEMAAHGTTSLELKTGYGLSVEAELRQARLARRLAEEVPQACRVTLLCHAVPEGFDRGNWVRMFAEELLPAAVAEGLVDAVDIYVEDIAFSVEDLGVLAPAAREAGLPIRCHAEQLGASGAAEALAALGGRSADHLNNASDAGIEALASSETVAVLLPASTLMLRAGAPPARALADAGAAVALATDFNPGTSPVLSMPEVIALGCTLYGLTPGEALVAATANPAYVLGLSEVGTLEPGKRADFLVLDCDDIGAIPYRPGHNPVSETWVGGTTV